MHYRIQPMNHEAFYCKISINSECLTAAFFFVWCLVSNFQNGSLDLSVFSGTHISENNHNYIIIIYLQPINLKK